MLCLDPLLYLLCTYVLNKAPGRGCRVVVMVPSLIFAKKGVPWLAFDIWLEAVTVGDCWLIQLVCTQSWEGVLLSSQFRFTVINKFGHCGRLLAHTSSLYSQLGRHFAVIAVQQFLLLVNQPPFRGVLQFHYHLLFPVLRAVYFTKVMMSSCFHPPGLSVKVDSIPVGFTSAMSSQMCANADKEKKFLEENCLTAKLGRNFSKKNQTKTNFFLALEDPATCPPIMVLKFHSAWLSVDKIFRHLYRI
eukprot:Gb_10519 [translate_table: standard]